MLKKLSVLMVLMAMVLIMNGCGKEAIGAETTGESMDYEEAGSNYTAKIGVALMDTGFYYQNQYMQLMYYDYETDQVTYVCSKPNCKHDRMDEECDANIHGTGLPMVFRDGRLYYTSDSFEVSGSKIVLCSVKPDGSDRKEECPVAEIANNSVGYWIDLYKHYIIIGYDIGDTHQKVELMDTDTGDKSVLYDKDDKLVSIRGPFAYYDYIYYGEVERDKDGKKINEKFYRYSLKTKEVSQIYEGIIEAVTFAKGYLIFSDGEAINRMPLAGGEVEKLFDYQGASGCDLSYDGKYLYIEHPHDYDAVVGDMQAKCDDNWVNVMKLDGTEVDTIKWNNRGYCLFGDQHMLLFDCAQEDSLGGDMVMMKKSDIGGEHHFIDLGNGEPYLDN